MSLIKQIASADLPTMPRRKNLSKAWQAGETIKDRPRKDKFINKLLKHN